MSISISVANALEYVRTNMRNQRLDVSNMEPGLSIANMTLQRLLAPPFRWRFNRANLYFDVSPDAGTDYPVTVTDFAFFDAVWCGTAPATPGAAPTNCFAMTVAQPLPVSSSQMRPKAVSIASQAANGNIVVRLDSTPDASYRVYADYQKRPRQLTSFASTFGPVTDDFAYIFNRWALAEGALLMGDSREEIFRTQAVSSAVAAQEGLESEQRATMIEQLMGTQRAAQRATLDTQQGVASRGKM